MNRVVVGRDQYEQMQRYLCGVKLTSVRVQIAAVGRITGQVAPGVWQPPLPPSLDPNVAVPPEPTEPSEPVVHSVRSKRERPASALLEVSDPQQPPEPKRP
ncbi:hypothetical protein KEM55_001684 [Ascosphaera atra]|nr:hypothetical protein KEM55_001684 [Ascosphaera atra]